MSSASPSSPAITSPSSPSSSSQKKKKRNNQTKKLLDLSEPTSPSRSPSHGKDDRTWQLMFGNSTKGSPSTNSSNNNAKSTRNQAQPVDINQLAAFPPLGQQQANGTASPSTQASSSTSSQHTPKLTSSQPIEEGWHHIDNDQREPPNLEALQKPSSQSESNKKQQDTAKTAPSSSTPKEYPKPAAPSKDQEIKSTEAAVPNQPANTPNPEKPAKPAETESQETPSHKHDQPKQQTPKKESPVKGEKSAPATPAAAGSSTSSTGSTRPSSVWLFYLSHGIQC